MKCVARLKDILKSLKQKNLLQDEELDVLKDLDMFNQQLLKRQVSHIKRASISKMYHPELRIFALTLHFYSPLICSEKIYHILKRFLNGINQLTVNLSIKKH